jgi:hypothetical protein
MEKHITVGVAGHVGHGKTSLEQCLTGVDTDRLKEEKQRGLSIEPGVARLQLPSGKETKTRSPIFDRQRVRLYTGTSAVNALRRLAAVIHPIAENDQRHSRMFLPGIQSRPAGSRRPGSPKALGGKHALICRCLSIKTLILYVKGVGWFTYLLISESWKCCRGNAWKAVRSAHKHCSMAPRARDRPAYG